MKFVEVLLGGLVDISSFLSEILNVAEFYAFPSGLPLGLNGVNEITQNVLDGLFSNLEYIGNDSARN